jgi:hypothetical protein
VGAHRPRGAPLPTSPRWEEESETVWSPTLIAFLIDDNVCCFPGDASVMAYGCLYSARSYAALWTTSPTRLERPTGNACDNGFRTRKRAGMPCSKPPICR